MKSRLVQSHSKDHTVRTTQYRPYSAKSQYEKLNDGDSHEYDLCQHDPSYLI